MCGRRAATGLVLVGDRRNPLEPPSTYLLPIVTCKDNLDPTLVRSLYHEQLIGAIMAVEIKGSYIVEVAIVAFILAEAGWTAG